MSLVNFTNLDFDQIKTSIKDYLRSNSNFTDYDFEGSNLSTIIDVLAYNTYITSYNANMVSNEVFIDSATLRENVVSLARNVGYVPKSYTSSRVVVSFFVDTSSYSTQPTSLTLQKGTVATSGSFNNKSYSFIVPEDITVPVIDNIASFDNITLYQGTYITNNFTVNSFDPNQRFILTNSKIDSSLIRVSVRSSINDTTAVTYNLSNTIFGIDGTSLVYFIQEIEDERYEIIFGDGIFGKKLEEPNYIQVDYVVTDGTESNGISSLQYVGRLVDQDGRVTTGGVSLLTLDQQSFGGASIESIESIKKYATKIYSSRYRAVTSSDYESLIPTIYPEAESVSAFGGEDLNPPQFGRVYISIKPLNGIYLSNTVKDNIKRDLKQYSVAGIIPEIIDLKYLYIEANSNVYYNTNQAPSADYVKSIVSTNVNQYANSTELNKFGARFKYSKFLKIIDDSHQSITSNITTITIRRDLSAILNAFTEYEICFGNRFHIKNVNGYNIKSSGFSVSGISGTVYMSDIPNGDGMTGTIFLFKLLSPTQTQIVRRSVGTIDYEKGEIKLNPINIISTVITKGTPTIEISTSPYSNDVIGLQDLYLVLDNNNVTLNMISDRISSGADISGSDYIVSSSYSNGLPVR
jgi:hypothetical protein